MSAATDDLTRQGHWQIEALCTALLNAARMEDTAVSYTHLDVYKRQAKGRTLPVATPAGAGIEPGMLRRLIQLCHPDKHQGSEAATTATAYLLAPRKGAAHG